MVGKEASGLLFCIESAYDDDNLPGEFNMHFKGAGMMISFPAAPSRYVLFYGQGGEGLKL